jgi:hypothetical protein
MMTPPLPMAIPPNPMWEIIRELRDAVPWDHIHPSGAGAAHEYLNEARACDHAPAALRLVVKAIEKIVEELEWQAFKIDPFEPEEADHLRREAKRIEHWLHLKEADAPKPLWRDWLADLTRLRKAKVTRND